MATTDAKPGFITPSNQATNVGTKDNNNSCSGITGCLAAMVYWIGPGFASWVASWAGYFFDYVVRVALLSPTYALKFLSDGWNLTLSLANMCFIFALIAAAIVIVLRADLVGTGRTVAWIIAIALLVNFSFFFTRVVIDAGNIIGVQFYNAVSAGATPTQVGGSGSTAVPDITKPIMNAIGVEKLLGGDSFNKVSNSLGGGMSTNFSTLLVFTVVFIFAAVMWWALAIALLMVGLKFLLRVVGLWLLLIASPLAFVAQTFSGTRHLFSQWLRGLVGLSSYPAVFLFMFWILNQFAGQLGGGTNLLGLGDSQSGSVINAASAQADQTGLLSLLANVSIRMMFIIALIWVMIKVSDWVIEQAGHAASGSINWVSRGVLGGGLRTAAWAGAFAGRNTIGRGAYAAAQSATLKNAAANSRFGIGSTLWRTTTALSRSTFDARNSTAARSSGRLVGTLSRTSDVSVGKGSQRTFSQSVDEKAKAVEKTGRAIGSASVKEVRDKGAETAARDARERLGAFVERKESRSLGNIVSSSWGNLKGAAALRKALDAEREKVEKVAKAASTPTTGAVITPSFTLRPVAAATVSTAAPSTAISTAASSARAPLIGSISDVPLNRISDEDNAARRAVIDSSKLKPVPPTPAAPAAGTNTTIPTPASVASVTTIPPTVAPTPATPLAPAASAPSIIRASDVPENKLSDTDIDRRRATTQPNSPKAPGPERVREVHTTETHVVHERTGEASTFNKDEVNKIMARWTRIQKGMFKKQAEKLDEVATSIDSAVSNINSTVAAASSDTDTTPKGPGGSGPSAGAMPVPKHNEANDDLVKGWNAAVENGKKAA